MCYLSVGVKHKSYVSSGNRPYSLVVNIVSLQADSTVEETITCKSIGLLSFHEVHLQGFS